jgi:hypothetical protein
MSNRKSNTWKMERASVNPRGKDRPRSNKYSGGDDDQRPAPHGRQRVWVGGYVRADGRKVAGYYRAAP